MNGSSGHLFFDGTLFDFIQKRSVSIGSEIDALTEAQLLAGKLDEYATALIEKSRLEPITLLTDKIVTERSVAKIDVRYDPFRMIRDQSRPHYVDGTALTFVVPFTGDPSILKLQPPTYSTSPPCGLVVQNEIHVKYEAIEIDPQKLQADFQANLTNIQRHLEWGEAHITGFNANLPSLIRGRWENRRAKFLKDRQAVAAIGFPIRERSNAPQVYNVPVRRKSVPVARSSPSGQHVQPDPVLEEKAYEDILQTIGSMTRVMELNPKAFAEMDEESLRFMLLVPLNIHYEGQATGETFNYDGKTDIIIKVGGQHIFVAECLIWDGPEYFKSKISQLLGYTSWRDTKTAIIIFNRNKNLSAVLAQIPDLVKQHSNFKHEITSYKNETGFRFVLHHRDDKNRELILTVLLFDVPS
ncbi:MAG TPA: hypothetical protein VG077_07100 [Verrucomicrobiae bacterium]|nr:hypothetical protein [Verrucomicrobiae bacterium]